MKYVSVTENAPGERIINVVDSETGSGYSFRESDDPAKAKQLLDEQAAEQEAARKAAERKAAGESKAADEGE